MINKKGFTQILILVIILAIGAIGGAYYLGTKQSVTVVPPIIPTVTTQTSQITIATSSVPDETTSWKIYTSNEGKYSFKYPENIKIYENEKFSVDGVKIPLKDTVVLLSGILPELNTNYQLSINHKITSASNIKDFIDQNRSCVSIDSGKGKPIFLGGKQALIFEDTLCGTKGMTSIYSLNNNIGYTIEVEFQAEYNKLKKYLDQIFATFKFT